MTEFRYLHGKVYILENKEAKRVKIGMTINEVEKRLADINSKWLGKKGTCQICGGRRLTDNKGFIPAHVVSGASCSGGYSLPLEKDSSLAKTYLEKMKIGHGELTGSEMGSFTRKIDNLKERIERFELFKNPVSEWRIDTVYQTDHAEDVELRSHQILSEFLDKTMPFGEVFRCSVEEARKAIDLVLVQLDLADSARKIILAKD